MKRLVMIFVVMMALTSMSFPEIPKASAKALGVTRGKPFSSGLVFVNGKYIEPPYVVERWGTGIRINGKQVTGQVIDWDEFLKTQDGVKVTKSESAPQAAAAEESSGEEDVEDDFGDDDDDDSLDDLFDDEPKPKKEAKRKPIKRAPPKPRVTVSYSLDGEFVANEKTEVLLKRINDERTNIDKTLRAGGFFCFGSRYSQIKGDSRIMRSFIDILPELQHKSANAAEFKAGIANAGIVYLNDIVCDELFNNRIDYRKLQERRDKYRSDKELERLIQGYQK